MQYPHFSKLEFGEVSAEVEAEKRPDLLVDSFVDRWNVEQKVASGDAFLLIGPKGSGKSTVVQYLRLKAERTLGQAFVEISDIGELYQSVEANLGGLEKSRTELAWRVFIWIRLYSLLMADQGSSISNDLDHVAFFKDLKNAGLAFGDLKAVIQEVKKRRHKFALPQGLYSYEHENTGERRIHADQLADILSHAVVNTQTQTPHYLALDGLDSAFVGNDGYWTLLANLLRASSSIHKDLRKATSQIRVILLCRSDIFLKIELPDSNKIRQGWGVELDWSYGVDDSRHSYLWDLVERKVAAGGGPDANILTTYFPSEMSYGQNSREEMSRYLLNMTRQTPRDILALFKSIGESSGSAHPLDVLRVRAGVNNYCKKYFTTEISNEFSGLVPTEIYRTLLGRLGQVPRRRFTRQEFEGLFAEACQTHSCDLDELLQQFFFSGAIANFISGRSENYVQFYHRRDYSDLNIRGPFLLHNALTLGLNVRW
ncbi:P-loop ATPase, Sll1717 family [Streptomyces inhibens]|uniref:P-loop ATPase, Sll1717 family n=1 Tax=Streptomyces inhibens TaxID=2293571 RepID=UPI000FFC83BA|nr:hypothetical protein [Streptomyces inhibens]